MLILSGCLMMFMKAINYIYFNNGLMAENRNVEIVGGNVPSLDFTAWTYTPLPQIIGILLIASGVLGVVKEMKAND
jgi:hypothetical protein